MAGLSPWETIVRGFFPRRPPLGTSGGGRLLAGLRRPKKPPPPVLHGIAARRLAAPRAGFRSPFPPITVRLSQGMVPGATA